jgi:hypothetical protein
MVNGGTGKIDIGGNGRGQELGGPPRLLTLLFIEDAFIIHPFLLLNPASCTRRKNDLAVVAITRCSRSVKVAPGCRRRLIHHRGHWRSRPIQWGIRLQILCQARLLFTRSKMG